MLSQLYAEDMGDTMTAGTARVVAEAQRRASQWPQGRCPACGTALDGGPVLFRCATCTKAVHAADLDMERGSVGP